MTFERIIDKPTKIEIGNHERMTHDVHVRDILIIEGKLDHETINNAQFSFILEKSANLQVKNIEFKGGATYIVKTTSKFSYIDSIIFESCIFADNFSPAELINLKQGQTLHSFQNIIFKNCTFKNNEATCLRLNYKSAENVIIDNNVFENNQTAMYLGPLTYEDQINYLGNVTISNNTVINCNGNENSCFGFNISGNNITFRNNHCIGVEGYKGSYGFYFKTINSYFENNTVNGVSDGYSNEDYAVGFHIKGKDCDIAKQENLPGGYGNTFENCTVIDCQRGFSGATSSNEYYGCKAINCEYGMEFWSPGLTLTNNLVIINFEAYGTFKRFIEVHTGWDFILINVKLYGMGEPVVMNAESYTVRNVKMNGQEVQIINERKN